MVTRLERVRKWVRPPEFCYGAAPGFWGSGYARRHTAYGLIHAPIFRAVFIPVVAELRAEMLELRP